MNVKKTKKNFSKKSEKLISGAEAIIKCLILEGVDVIFGYPGGAIMPVYDALYSYKKDLRHILSRHEQGAIHCAQGYARSSGEVGVCLATSGPGATNLLTGIADAQIDSTPLVCITGQVHSYLLGTDAFQETDVLGVSTPVTKWNCQVKDAKDIPSVLAKAFYIARSGRPGPVLIDITKDAQIGKFVFSYEKCIKIRGYLPNPEVNKEAIRNASELINNAKKPFVLFGQGVLLANAESELKKFIEKAGIPSASTLMGLSALPSDHPLYVGMLGMHGNYAPNKLTNECDVLIAVGMRFDDRVTGDLSKYAKQAKVIHFEIDPSEVNKNIIADVAVIGDCRETIGLLIKLLKPKTHTSWLNEFYELRKVEEKQVIIKEITPSSKSLTMGEVIFFINKISKGNAIVVSDVGQHQMIASRYLKFNQTKSFITSGGLGTMGFCLPAAIGAKIGAPEKQVIAIIGDGGFQMTIQELGVILQEGVDIKILILNNEFLGMVRQWQELFFEKRYSATEIVNPDFQQIAKGYGLPSKKINERYKLEKAVREMLLYDGSYLLEVVVGKKNNVFPMIETGCSVSEIRLS